MKIAINACYGKFNLSSKAIDLLTESLDAETYDALRWTDEFRAHPALIEVINHLGPEANGPHANLKIIEIPDDVDWEINEYDGLEHIAERHRTWN